MSNVLVENMELVAGKGRVGFQVKNEDGSTGMFSHFGTIKGTAKWCKVLEPDQYDNYAVDIYSDITHITEEANDIIERAKELVIASGKVVNGVADFTKVDNEGVEYVQFKRKGTKSDGTTNTPPKIYTASGIHDTNWSALIGNGSTVGVAYMLSPYYMASTKLVGVSCRFYALQVIDLKEFKAGGGSSPFGNESGETPPFDTSDNDEF